MESLPAPRPAAITNSPTRFVGGVREATVSNSSVSLPSKGSPNVPLTVANHVSSYRLRRMARIGVARSWPPMRSNREGRSCCPLCDIRAWPQGLAVADARRGAGRGAWPTTPDWRRGMLRRAARRCRKRAVRHGKRSQHGLLARHGRR